MDDNPETIRQPLSDEVSSKIPAATSERRYLPGETRRRSSSKKFSKDDVVLRFLLFRPLGQALPSPL